MTSCANQLESTKLGQLTTSNGATDGHPPLEDANDTSGEHFGTITDIGAANAWVHWVRDSIAGILIPFQGI